MPVPHERVLPVADLVPDLLVKALVGVSLLGGHPRNHLPFRPCRILLHEVLRHVPGVEHDRVHPDSERVLHVVEDLPDGVRVQHVAGDEREPHGEAGRLVHHEHQAGLHRHVPDSVAAQGVERVVLRVVGQRRGVDVAPLAELGVDPAHGLHPRLEEPGLDLVVAHHREERGVSAEGGHRNVARQVRDYALAHEQVACDACALLEDGMQAVAEEAAAVRVRREHVGQNAGNADGLHEMQQEVCVPEDRVDARGGEKAVPRYPRVV